MAAELIYELQSLDDASRLTAERQAVVLPSPLAARMKTAFRDMIEQDRANVLKTLSTTERVGYFEPNVVYSIDAMETVEKETGLATSEVLSAFDGTFDLYETAALLILAKAREDESVRETIDQMTDEAKRFIARISAAPSVVVQTKVRPLAAVWRMYDPAPPPIEVPTEVAKALYRLASPTEKTTLAMVSRGFASLIKIEPVEEYSIRNEQAFPALFYYFKKTLLASDSVYKRSQTLHAALLKVVSLPVSVEYERKKALARSLVDKGTVDSMDAAFQAVDKMIDDAATKGREALALLNRRAPLGSSELINERQQRNMFLNREVDLMQRVFGNIAAHPTVHQALLRPGIFALVDDPTQIRIMDGETIKREHIDIVDGKQVRRKPIYVPQNLYAMLENSAPLESDPTIESIARFVGLQRSRTTVDIASRSFQTSEKPVQIVQRADGSIGAYPAVPDLIGRYYVYQRDLPEQRSDPDPMAVREHPQMMFLSSHNLGVWTMKFVRTLVATSTTSKYTYLPAFSTDSEISDVDQTFEPIIVCQQRVDTATGLPYFRVESYIVANAETRVTDTRKSEIARAKASLMEKKIDLKKAYATMTLIQEEIENSDPTEPEPNDLSTLRAALYANAVKRLRDSLTAYYDEYESLPAEKWSIVAAEVWETPPLTRLTAVPSNLSEIRALVDNLAPTRSAFRLTRAIVRVDAAIQTGIEQFVTQIPALFSLSANSLLYTYWEQLRAGISRTYFARAATERGITEGEIPPAIDTTLTSDAWNRPQYKQTLTLRTDDLGEKYGRAIVENIRDTFVRQFGTVEQWIARHSTSNYGSRYGELEYRVLELKVLGSAFYRAAIASKKTTFFDDSSLNELNVESFHVDGYGVAYGVIPMREALTQTRDAIVRLFGETLEPAFTRVAADPSARAKILAALNTGFGGTFVADPFGEGKIKRTASDLEDRRMLRDIDSELDDEIDRLIARVDDDTTFVRGDDDDVDDKVPTKSAKTQ